jgi:PAS domain S-box-containing protein
MMEGEFIESILKIFAVRAAAELERQRADETLRRSEASYRAIFEASEDAIFIHDRDTGAVIDVNRRPCEIYGYDYDELRRIGVGDLSSGVHPYTGEEAARRLAEARSGKTVRFEWHRRNRDGSLHWDEVVLRPAVIAGERRIVAFTREVTERKQAEQALRQAQKMEALGHLTGGIAHDFNNLLTSIMGYVALAADPPPGTSAVRIRHYLEQARLSCVRARDLIQQMLTFSRGQRGNPRPIVLPPLVGESLKLFASSLPSSIEVQTDLDRDVAAVMIDPVQLDQVLLNLCLNARDAMDGAGTIRIGVQQVCAQQRVCTSCRQALAGELVELSIEDSGPGIDPEVVDRIFEPFFTTKALGKGSGMGLASVHGVVHELGGHILVDTAIGRGTRFSVLLPALANAGDEAVQATAERPRPQVTALRGRVLVVDDEQSVGAFMRDLLESWGVDVTVAASAPEAAAWFARDPYACDLVITDQAMPRVTGLELARDLIAARPELPVILYTGFNEGIDSKIAKAARLRAVVTKPIDPQELFALLRSHLSRAET